jgi:hypothetical protein
MQAEVRRRIDPTTSPVRASLWKTGDRRHLLCLNVHHLATDAWSGSIQIRDLKILYDHEARKHTPPQPPLMQYADFTSRQEQYFRSERFKRDLEYWRKRLTGAAFDSVPLTPAGSTGRRTAVARIGINRRNSYLLTSLSKSSQTTLFSLMLALYFVTLYRLTGKRDLSVASLFANRMTADIRDTVGFVANLTVLRCTLQPGSTYRSLITSVQAHVREAFIHQACPLHLLPSEITIRDGRRADEAVFQMLPQAMNRSRMGEVELKIIAPDAIDSRFELEVTTLIEQDELAIIVFWNRNRLAHEWISDFLRQYSLAMDTMLRDPDSSLF